MLKKLLIHRTEQDNFSKPKMQNANRRKENPRPDEAKMDTVTILEDKKGEESMSFDRRA